MSRSGSQHAEPRVEIARLRLQLERWRDVAYIDGADVFERAEREGVDVEDEEALSRFLEEFHA